MTKEKKQKLVKTVGGGMAPPSVCVKISNKYHIKDVDCVLVDDEWVAHSNKFLRFDSRSQMWRLANKHMLYHGVVAINDGVLQMGYYSPCVYTQCLVKSTFERDNEDASWRANVSDVMSSELFKNNPDYIEIYESDQQTFISKQDAIRLRIKPGRKSVFAFNNQGYNIEECLDFHSKEKLYKESIIPIDNSVKKMSKILGDVTFGVEVETTLGILPRQLCNKLGIVICKDGSINYSPEYTSVKYSGEKGMQALKILFEELEPRTITNESCSLHYHFGNIRTDREFLIALHKLYYNIQGELFLMFPYYKREHYGLKKKNYNQQLPNIISNYNFSQNNYKEFVNIQYNKLYSWTNDGQNACIDFNRKNNNHVKGNQKWNISKRYSICNFVNMMFSQRRTIEMRLHHGTTNKTKALNWFFICLATIKFAEKYSTKILTDQWFEYDLKSILHDIYPNTSTRPIADYLGAYIDNRRKFHEDCFNLGDKLSKAEYSKEQNFTFTHSGLTHII